MLLGLSFFIIALLYASVGFGGGSSYLALLILWGAPFAIIPLIALLCNIVVVAGNSIHYLRAGHVNWRLFLPLALTSVPMAFIGGQLPIDKYVFMIILCIALAVTGARLLFQSRHYHSSIYISPPTWVSAILGAVLGFLAGITGIGGGIFLAPILYAVRAGSSHQIAAISSLFIFVNSISGIIGQFQKSIPLDSLQTYWYLPILALAGGQLGNLLMLKFLPPRLVALLTAVLVLYVAGQLGLRIWKG